MIGEAARTHRVAGSRQPRRRRDEFDIAEVFELLICDLLEMLLKPAKRAPRARRLEAVGTCLDECIDCCFDLKPVAQIAEFARGPSLRPVHHGVRKYVLYCSNC